MKVDRRLGRHPLAAHGRILRSPRRSKQVNPGHRPGNGKGQVPQARTGSTANSILTGEACQPLARPQPRAFLASSRRILAFRITSNRSATPPRRAVTTRTQIRRTEETKKTKWTGTRPLLAITKAIRIATMITAATMRTLSRVSRFRIADRTEFFLGAPWGAPCTLVTIGSHRWSAQSTVLRGRRPDKDPAHPAGMGSGEKKGRLVGEVDDWSGNDAEDDGETHAQSNGHCRQPRYPHHPIGHRGGGGSFGEDRQTGNSISLPGSRHRHVRRRRHQGGIGVRFPCIPVGQISYCAHR